MNKKLKSVLENFSKSLGLEMVMSFSPKGGRKQTCCIYKKSFNTTNVQLRLHINFVNNKVESYRIGLNHMGSSELYNDFIQWDYANHVYMDNSYVLEDSKRELFNITVFKDEHFEPKNVEDVIPVISEAVEGYADNEEFYISKMIDALNTFTFNEAFYKDLSTNFMIRCLCYWRCSKITKELLEIEELALKAGCGKGQPGRLMLEEFFSFIDGCNKQDTARV